MNFKKFIIDKQLAQTHVLEPLSKAGFNVRLIGSVATKGQSTKDIDILLTLPKYPQSETEFKRFEQTMEQLGWVYRHTDENEDNPEWGIFHNYEKGIDDQLLGLDVFVEEK